MVDNNLATVHDGSMMRLGNFQWLELFAWNQARTELHDIEKISGIIIPKVFHMVGKP